MAYTKNTWARDDLITAAKLNNIENGVEALDESVSVIEPAVENKADKDGVYPKLIAGGIIESEIKDEEFTYQQTEHTGIANLNSIKGNTLVWNQLITSTNIRETRTVRGVVFTNNNNGSITLNGTAESTSGSVGEWNITTVSGHKYIFTTINDSGEVELSTSSEKASQGNIYIKEGVTYNITYYPYCIDLTKMFGSGNEPTTVAEFTSLFPLPYYAYNTGSLLSFTGTGIKTTGKNLCDNSTITVGYYTSQSLIIDNNYRTSALIPVMPNTTYIGTLFDGNGTEISRLVYTEWDGSGNFISQSISSTITTSSQTAYLRVRNFLAQQPYIDSDNFLYQLEIGSSASSYEPYTSSTLSLPISTYFPTGMKDVPDNTNGGKIYDELSDKAITRVGTIDLGSIEWAYTSNRAYSTVLNGIAKPSTSIAKAPNMIADKMEVVSANSNLSNGQITFVNISGEYYVFAYYDGVNSPSGNLNYELATYTETDVDLDLTYRTYEGGTEQLLPINTDEPTTSPIKVNVEFDFDENLNARIEKMLGCLAQVETSPTTHAYSSGDYLMYNYQLYKVTSSIAVGGTLTVGTNISATTVMSELLSLTA